MAMRSRPSGTTKKKKKHFVDLFAGCGGLSLGLLNAGWKGSFAIEKNRDAFNTFSVNLLHRRPKRFNWPKWLPEKAKSTSRLLTTYGAEIQKLRGKIDLIAGAPPCQGFSLAGRRIHSDPRNSLIREYIRIVKRIQPRFLLLENVQGFDFPFKKNGHGEEKNRPYSEIMASRLRALGYVVFPQLVDFSAFGIPQSRKRFILIAIKKGDSALDKLRGKTPFDLLTKNRKQFLRSKGLPIKRSISSKQAIADLEISAKKLIENTDCKIKGFRQLDYEESPRPSAYISLMRKGNKSAPDSLRLARHKPATIRYFKKIMATCAAGQTLKDDDRKRLKTKKQALTPLAPGTPSVTVTTLPDDMIHYAEPRILTVRENARLQSFPDWFIFTGNYTTGGRARRNSCPRYTQVGNAVPPLFSEAVGIILKRLCH